MAGTIKKDLHIGGQAIFEGVMLKSNDNIAAVVRKGNKFITYKKRTKNKNTFLKLPFVRGIVNLIEMLDIGIKTLIWSSNQILDEDEEMTGKDIFFMLATSIFLVILFFIAAPAFLTKLVIGTGFWFSLVEGLIRISFFIIYILAISLSKEVKTLFQYHGAEHKVVNCFEDKKPLTLNNVKRFTTLHKRCGTSFIIIVLLLSILVFSVVPYENIFQRIGLKIILMPLIVSLSYEFIKIGAKHKKNFLFHLFTLPGLWLQKVTTREPTKKQLEVALETIKVLLKMEGKK